MRLLIILLLLAAPLLTLADGFAYGKHFNLYQETDQLAVVNLKPGMATVDMFINIDGIPAGESVTYILPFWNKPEDFILEEMERIDYLRNIARPAHDQLALNNRLAEHESSESMLEAAAVTGVAEFPATVVNLFSILAKRNERARQGWSSQSYQIISTPHANAKLFQIGQRDLQEFISAAKFPPSLRDQLKSYRTDNFAVMTLTGPKAPVKTADKSSKGIHYHFRLPLSDNSYTYPLGTGAAWPKPILCTELYITCPQKCFLQVKAPDIGQQVDYDLSIDQIRMLQDSNTDDNEAQTWNEPSTSHLLNDSCSTPTAWHVMYLNSNPKDDIHIRFNPRAFPGRFALANAFFNRSLTYPLALGTLIFSWMLALWLVMRPCWRRAADGKSFASWWWYYLWRSFLEGLIISPLLLLLGTVAATMINGPDQLWGFCGTVAFFCFIFVGICIMKAKAQNEILQCNRYATWLSALGIYILLSMISVGIAYWAETVVQFG